MRAVRRGEGGDAAADLTEAVDPDPQTLERGLAVQVGRHRAQRRVDSDGGGGRGLADTSLLLGQAQRVRTALRDDSEVGGGGADVLPGQVATAEVDHEVPEVEEQCAPVRRLEDGTNRQCEH